MNKRHTRIKPLEIRNLVIGGGMPKICLPVGGVNGDRVLDDAAMAVAAKADMVGWRADHLRVRDAGAIRGVLSNLREGVQDMPILFTCRSREAGGRAELEPDAYADMLLAVIKQGKADMVDIELNLGDREVRLSCRNPSTTFLS